MGPGVWEGLGFAIAAAHSRMHAPESAVEQEHNRQICMYALRARVRQDMVCSSLLAIACILKPLNESCAYAMSLSGCQIDLHDSI